MPTLKGAGVTDSIQKLRSAVKRGSGGSGIQSIPADSEINVHFLSEPTKWFHYEEHYDSVLKFFPCITEGCVGCDDGLYASKKYIAPAIDLDNSNEVKLYKLPKTVLDSLLSKHERWGTLLDRDYAIERTGSGKDDTRYDVTPLGERKIRPEKYPFPSTKEVMKLVLSVLPDAELDDDDDVDEDEDVAPVSHRRASSTTRKRPPRRTVDLDDEDDDDDDDVPPARKPLKRPGQARAEREASLGRSAPVRSSTARTAPKKPVRKPAPVASTTRKPIRRSR